MTTVQPVEVVLPISEALVKREAVARSHEPAKCRSLQAESPSCNLSLNGVAALTLSDRLWHYVRQEVCMALIQVSARLNLTQLRRAQKALGAKTTSETLQRALDLVTEKAEHDRIVQRYSGVGKPDAFSEDH